MISLLLGSVNIGNGVAMVNYNSREQSSMWSVILSSFPPHALDPVTPYYEARVKSRLMSQGAFAGL